MKMLAWCVYALALLLAHTTIVVDGEFPGVDVVKFNACVGAPYMGFEDDAHEAWKRDSESLDDGDHINLPETPKDLQVPPNRWVKVNLFSGSSCSTPKSATYIRKDSVYTLGFRNVDGEVHHSPLYPHFFTDFRSAIPLPFLETYAGLTNTPPNDPVYPKIVKIQIGRAAAALAIETLSSFRGDRAAIEDVMHAYLTMTIMTSEALRIKSVAKACRDSWEGTGTLTVMDVRFMYAWSGLSLLCRTNDLGQLSKSQKAKVRKTGITTGAQACNVIDLVYRSKP